jgi:5-methylcytosine-specific restriction enzyme subunit McrC
MMEIWKGTGGLFAENASGLLLHPSVGEMVNEAVVIQNHEIRFATVDLGGTAKEVREQLLQVLGFSLKGFQRRTLV